MVHHRTFLPATLFILLASFSSFARAAVPSQAQQLAGTWLVETSIMNHSDRVQELWNTKLTITGNTFAASHFYGSPKDITGTFTLHPDASPKTIDLNSGEIDLSSTGEPVTYPATQSPGIYKLEGNRLTICFEPGADSKRPLDFKAIDTYTDILTLVRADPGFTDFPATVKVNVVNPDGSPAPGQILCRFMSHIGNRINPDAVSQWMYFDTTPDLADGTAEIAYSDFGATVVRDTRRHLIGFNTNGPAALQHGLATIRLQPECMMHGTIESEEFKKAGLPIGWTNVYLYKDGQRVASSDSVNGKFEFPVAPGNYTLDAYGKDLQGQYIDVTVPAGRSEYQIPPISLTGSSMIALQSHPAPELAGIVAWKGQPQTIAALKGKIVLIDFWGYWCGPCVHAMPVLIQLREKFKETDLVIIGVHVDMDGEVDTVAKLDEKIASLKATLWDGKDLPFPIALSSGVRSPSGYQGTAAEQYGVLSYPTTILIDKQGNVVGEFAEARNAGAAIARIGELLGQTK